MYTYIRLIDRRRRLIQPAEPTRAPRPPADNVSRTLIQAAHPADNILSRRLIRLARR
jgi:hypothetical protein